MPKNKRRSLIAGTVFLLLISASAAFAAFSDTVSVTNHVFTGDVNIGIVEKELREDTLIDYENPKTVFPGDLISKIPNIVNLASPCWVRARILTENDRDDLEGITEDMIQGIPEEWKKYGEYYYLTKPLGHGESSVLFSRIHIPETWTEEHAEQGLKLIIRAEAVQEVHFTPDFTAMSPWGDQEIELCVHANGSEIIEHTTDTRLSVEYSGDAHRLVAAPEDFFTNLGELMPGDHKTDTVHIKNTTDKKSELFFYTGYEDQTKEQLELLSNLFLTIRYRDEELYKGTLTAEALQEGVSLGWYEPGDEAEMTYEIDMPPGLGNAYAKRDADVKWIFAVREEEPPQATGYTGGGGSPAVYTGTGTAAPVRTGDDTIWHVYVILSIMAAAALILTICMKKRRAVK